MGFCLVCVMSVAVWAQTGPSIDDLLRRTNEQSKQNEPKTREYVYRERIVTDEFNEKGESSNRHTETWEAIGLEGSEYRKLIQRDDMPLSTKEQKKEDERLRKETEKRRKEKTLGRKNPLQRTYSFGYSTGDERFFDFRYMGEELTGGRPAYLFEGTPKAHQRPTNNHEKQLLLSRVKLWIDKEDTFVSSLEIEVLQEGADMRPGTRLALTQQRMEDGTWLLQELRGRLVIKPLRVMNVRKDLVMTRSDYHKFSVDSRIIDTQ